MEGSGVVGSGLAAAAVAVMVGMKVRRVAPKEDGVVLAQVARGAKKEMEALRVDGEGMVVVEAEEAEATAEVEAGCNPTSNPGFPLPLHLL